MDDQTTKADLLNAWRDALRAAELAERLAATAAKAVEEADQRVVAAGELADLAEQAAASAARAAARATAAAAQAADLAKALRGDGLGQAKHTLDTAKATEVHARAAYRQARPERHDETVRAE